MSFTVCYIFILAEVFIKYINNTTAWVALKDATYAKAMNKVLPKVQALHKNIILLPWSVYYQDQNTTTVTTKTKRKIEECSSAPSDDLDSSTVKDECAIGQTPEKVARFSKG